VASKRRPTRDSIHVWTTIPKTIKRAKVDENRGNDYDNPSNGDGPIARMQTVGKLNHHLEHHP